MKKTIKVNELKKRIEMLVNDAIRYKVEGKDNLYNYCYNKAICLNSIIEEMCIDYTKPSFEKEYREMEDWFTEITNNAIYK